MQRTIFSEETKILGEDFEEILKRFGGKNAGIKLVEKLVNDYDFYVPDYVPISTDLYTIAQEILREEIKSPNEEYIRQEGIKSYHENEADTFLNLNLEEILLKDPNFKSQIHKELRKIRRKFNPNDSKNEGLKFHIRSSSTIEDFRDDRYYGTFKTNSYFESPFFKRNTRDMPRIVSGLIDQIKWFYAMKEHWPYDMELEGENLAMMVMASHEHQLHITSYSSYPETNNSTVIHEIGKSTIDESPDPLCLIKVHGDKIKDVEIIPATYEAYEKFDSNTSLDKYRDFHSLHERINPYSINGVRSPINIDQINKLTKILQRLEDTLGYSVNTEILMNKESSEYDYYSLGIVQIRPTPILENFKPLEDLSENYTLLFKTPFVKGIFEYEAPVLLTLDKNISRWNNNTVREPSIIYDTEDNKGHRMFYSDESGNCLAMINPQKGWTLSHGYSVYPVFGEDRERFHLIGIPEMTNLWQKLKPIDWEVKGNNNNFRRTQFPLKIESDGRNGRVSIDNRYLEQYKTDDFSQEFQNDGWTDVF